MCARTEGFQKQHRMRCDCRHTMHVRGCVLIHARRSTAQHTWLASNGQPLTLSKPAAQHVKGGGVASLCRGMEGLQQQRSPPCLQATSGLIGDKQTDRCGLLGIRHRPSLKNTHTNTNKRAVYTCGRQEQHGNAGQAPRVSANLMAAMLTAGTWQVMLSGRHSRRASGRPTNNRL